MRRFRRHLLWYASATRYLRCKSDQQLVIVTGASRTHFQSLIQFTESVLKHEPFSHLVIFDLGLTQIQLDRLQELISTNQRAEIRRFPFELYPPHMNIEVADGEYAWKPVIVHQVCEQSDGFVIWCDAGNIIDKPLTWIRRIVQKDGIYCPISSGIVTDWTHPGMISELGLPEKYFNYRNLNGAVIGLNPRLPRIAQLLTDWKDCALKPECIAPAGSSRQNHKQDQAAFTAIAYKNNIIQQRRRFNYYLNLIWEPHRRSHPIGMRIQQDIDMKQSRFNELPRLTFEKYFSDSEAITTSIVTVFNQQSIIRNVLEALIRSTSTQTDLIVIDDGSEDHTATEIVRAINEIEWDRYLFSSVKIYRNLHSKFEAFCDDFGVKIARTKYAILVQADVLITEYGFDRILLSALTSFPDLLMVSGRGTQLLLPVAKDLRQSSGSSIGFGKVFKFALSRKYTVNYGHNMRVIASTFITVASILEFKLYWIFKRRLRAATVTNNNGHEIKPSQSKFSSTGNAGYLGHHTHTENSNFKDEGTMWVSQTVMRGPICINKDKFVECEGLDTNSYFLAFDDHDLSLRAYLKHKYRVGFAPIGYHSEPTWGTTRKKRSFRQTQLVVYESLRISNYQKTTDLYALKDPSSPMLPSPEMRNFGLIK